MTEVAVMNLWLMNGHAPSDGRNVSAVLRSFEFVPGTTYALQPAANARQTSFAQYPDGCALKNGRYRAGVPSYQISPSGAYTGYMYDLLGSSVDVRVEAVPALGNGSSEGIWWLRYDINN